MDTRQSGGGIFSLRCNACNQHLARLEDCKNRADSEPPSETKRCCRRHLVDRHRCFDQLRV